MPEQSWCLIQSISQIFLGQRGAWHYFVGIIDSITKSDQFYLDVVEKEEQKNNIFTTFHNNRPINIQAAAV